MADKNLHLTFHKKWWVTPVLFAIKCYYLITKKEINESTVKWVAEQGFEMEIK